ncbi:MAG: hypothetical protein KY445_08245 [Armatimonadetes bacterium]|nr:hypothetical protein [Armatimonadota bacterium]
MKTQIITLASFVRQNHQEGFRLCFHSKHGFEWKRITRVEIAERGHYLLYTENDPQPEEAKGAVQIHLPA